MNETAPIHRAFGRYTLELTLSVDGTWNARLTLRDGSLVNEILNVDRLRSSEEAEALCRALLIERISPSPTTLERELGLAPGSLAALDRTECLVLNGLQPAGNVVSRDRLRRARVDAGVGPEIRQGTLSTTVTRARKKLALASDGICGLTTVSGRGFYLWHLGAEDWIEAGPLRFSRTGLVAEVNGWPNKLTMAVAFFLEPLARAAASDRERCVPREELLAALGPVTAPAARDARLRSKQFSATAVRLREATGLRIAWVPGRGYRLVLPQAS